MVMTTPHTIRRDINGLFIRTGGYVFRPLFPVDYPHLESGTIYQASDKVRAHHMAGTPLAKIKRGDHVETWFSHGSYYTHDCKIRPSASCFKPIGFCWKGGMH